MFFPVADDQVDHYATSMSVQALAAAITSCGVRYPKTWRGRVFKASGTRCTAAAVTA